MVGNTPAMRVSLFSFTKYMFTYFLNLGAAPNPAACGRIRVKIINGITGWIPSIYRIEHSFFAVSFGVRLICPSATAVKAPGS